jgi:Nucleotidyl transferase AbiEii toxin, Type IV TA system
VGETGEGQRLGRTKRIVNFHEAVLNPSQVQVLHALGPFARDAGFYLAGGTAIALRFGHRRSEDFDWFKVKFHRPDALKAQINALGLDLKDPQIDTGTLIGLVHGVKVSFFEYAYQLLDPLDSWSEFGIDVASLRDLGAMKLLAIAQRGSRKDFVDVYEILREGRTLSGMLLDFRERFQTDPISVLRGLTYFDDADREPMPEMLVPREWDQMRRAIRAAVRATTG